MVSVCSDGDRDRLTGMASPIEATTTLRGEDARRLIESLENRCSNEEAERRMAWAKKAMAEMMRPKNTKAAAKMSDKDALAYIESREQRDPELAEAVHVELDKIQLARKLGSDPALVELAADARVMAKNLVFALKHGELLKKVAIACAATLLDSIADALDNADQDHEEVT